jgi:hypothetical protein
VRLSAVATADIADYSIVQLDVVKHFIVVVCLTRVWPVFRQNDGFDGCNHRGWWDACGGKRGMNLGELVWRD